MIDVIVDTIKNTDKAEVEKSISKMFDEAIKKNMPPDIIRQLSMQLIMRAIKEISDIGVDMDKLLQVENNNVYEVLNEFETIEQIKGYLEKMFYKFIDIIIEKRSLRSNRDLMDKILKYINLNYMNYDLTLNSLADEFGLSVPYLSKIFKESFEANFTDYIIGIRMEKAKELLSDTDLKVGEITERVGYANAHSFIRIFKKYLGMTPGEYRSSLIK
jgi:YesN/AraC family two-component response regulator